MENVKFCTEFKFYVNYAQSIKYRWHLGRRYWYIHTSTNNIKIFDQTYTTS